MRQVPEASAASSTAVVGFVVVLWEHGAWNLSWDGELHRTREEAAAELAEAREAGWDVRLAEVRAEYEDDR